jgi:hypothetical protein
MTGHMPSSWAANFNEWMGNQGLECLNPENVPTWKQGDSSPSIIDLAFTNEPALISAQLGPVSISREDSLGSDHAALALTLYPTHSLTLVPPPAPTGYHAEDKHKDMWMKEFAMLLPTGLPYAPSHCTEPIDQESTPERRSANAVTVHESLNAFNDAIQSVCARTLPSKRHPNPKGARWWNEACSSAHTLACSAIGNEAWHTTSINLNHTIAQAKCDWAHA